MKISPVIDNDKDENLESQEEAAAMERNIDDISMHMATNVTVEDDDLASRSNGKPHESGAKMDLENSVFPEVCFIGWKRYIGHLFSSSC